MSHHGKESGASPFHDFDIADNKALDELRRVFRDKALGKTGEFPSGKLREDDEGGVLFAVGKERGKVVIQFGEPTKWVGMEPQQAIDLASLLIKHARSAGVAINKVLTLDIQS